jgi:hypothetical protein
MSAQTAEQDLQKVLEPLLNARDLYFENQYLYYDEGHKTPSDTLDGVFQRNGAQEYARMGQLEVLDTGALTVTADHEDKVVSAQNSAAGRSLNELVNAEQLKGLLETREAKLQYAPGRGGWKAVSLTDPESPDDKMIIYFDPVNWTIKEASVTTDDPFADPYNGKVGKVTITVRYLNYTTAPKTFPYKVEQYVRKVGKQYVATGKCKGYRVI